jgi:putative DNA primase/helicase
LPNCHPGKHPITRGGHLDATTDAQHIATWWEKHPRANIGLNCEAAGIVVVDLDPRNGSEATWRALEAAHGSLRSTVWSRTGGGGEHHFFRAPEGDWAPIEAAFRRGVDIKFRGYVVLPPSRHESGTDYQWGAGGDPAIILDLLSGELPPLPAAFILGGEVGQAEADDDGEELTEYLKAEARTDLSFDEFAAAVRSIRNDDRFSDRADWLNVGAGIHHETNGSAEGLALFVEWSKTWTGGDYDPKATEAAWRSFKGRARRLKRGAYILQLAQADGWRNPAKANPDGLAGDIETGRAFAERYAGQFKFIKASGAWLIWDGSRWAPCQEGQEVEAMKAIATERLIAAAADVAQNPSDLTKARHKAAIKLADAYRIEAGLKMARSEEAIRARPDSFDIDPMLLGVRNGVLNLKSGHLVPPTPQQFISKQAGTLFLEAAECPLWLAFLEKVQPDAEVRAFLKRAVGYTLTGSVDEEVLFFAHGVGANGKSVFANVLTAMMGDFALPVGSAVLIKNKHGNDNEADRLIAEMPGARLVLANETKASDVWNDEKLKGITSRERISARKNYGHPFSFMPTHKLWIRGNHLPGSHDAGEGFWRRLIPIPFTQQIPEAERIPDLDRQIIARELPGVLNWALEGCLEWQRAGLGIPKSIRQEAAGYRADTDILGLWLSERTATDPSGLVPARDAYQSFQGFCRDQGVSAPAAAQFGRQMSARGIRQAPGRKSGRQYAGITLTFDQVDDLFA